MQERHGDRGLDLSALVSLDLYRRNAFRLSGLPVDASLRQLRRRSQEIEAAARLGDDGLITGDPLYPVRPQPPAEEVLTALQRIRDPNQRLLDEWFWLWPVPDVDVEDATADDVRRAWSDAAGTGQSHAAAAVHNLAVTAHLKALEAGKSAKSVEGTWNRAYRRWRQVLRDEGCWAWLERRVEAIADPQLQRGAVAELRRELPALLLEIHAELAVAAARQPTRAKLHVTAMRASGFDRDVIDRALSGAVQSHLSRLRALGERARDAARSREPYEPVVKSIVEAMGDDLDVVDLVVGRDHPVASGVTDRLAGGLRECVVAGVNLSGADGSNRPEDYAQAVRWLDQARTVAGKGHVGQQIETDMVTLLTNQVVVSCNAALEKPRGAKTYTLAAERRMVEQTRAPMQRLKKLDRAGHDTLCDEVAGTSLVMLVDYANHHGPGGSDVPAVLSALRKALELAKAPELSRRIRKAIDDIEAISRPARTELRYEPRPGSTTPDEDRAELLRRIIDGSFYERGAFGSEFGGAGSPLDFSRDGVCALCGGFALGTRYVALANNYPADNRIPEVRFLEVSSCTRCSRKRLALVPLQAGMFFLGVVMIVLLVAVALSDSLTMKGDTGYWIAGIGLLMLLADWNLTIRKHRHARLAESPALAALIASDWRIVR
jgi:hypothetical protein